MMEAPLTPDAATRRDQIRRFIDVLAAAAGVSAVLSAAQGMTGGGARSWEFAIMLGAYTLVVVGWPRRILAHGRLESAVVLVAIASAAVIFGTAIIEPSSALIASTALLIPITAAVPYLEVGSLRLLMILAWVVTIATASAGLLPDPATGSAAVEVGRLWGPVVVSGLVLFLLYESSERMKASTREFRRLFDLSSELADATEPGTLGDLVARHLADATGMDDCVVYVLGPDGGSVTPFGYHPAGRALAARATSAVERPILARVIRDRTRATIDVGDPSTDPVERAGLSALGRSILLLLPLVGRAEPVGVAELTSARSGPIDERRLALARTLAFEAAMAIENGRLYQEVWHRSLHDPLTGLANRSLFLDRVGQALARLTRLPGASVAVLYIDVDDFKMVNDTMGHGCGDRLLTLVADRLGSVARVVDTVARLGGDEFAMALEATTAEGAILVADRVLRALGEPFDLDGRPVSVRASIGVAARSDANASAEDLVQEADAAMYAAKRSGKGVVRTAVRRSTDSGLPTSNPG